jgi:hypothetical protein
MRLYFHLLDHQDSLPDQEGVEVINVREAQAAVLEMLHVLRQEDESAAQDWSGWTLNVTDPIGHTVFSIDLSAVE